MNLIEIDQQLLKNITGGCFCYCITNSQKITTMSNVFVKETSNEQECRSVCMKSQKLPYYGYASCPDGLYHLLFNSGEVRYPQAIIDNLNYRNGGWRVDFPNCGD